MSTHPILAALRRHKAGVILIALQIALTLAIVCNAIFIIGQRINRVNRPTGIDEANLFVISQQWVGTPSGDGPDVVNKIDSRLLADLDTLRRLPGVESVAPTNSLPLFNSSQVNGITLTPDQKDSTLSATMFLGDNKLLNTLGVQLVAGRAFTAADVQHQAFRDDTLPPSVIVSQAAAEKLFPNQSAVGKMIYSDGKGTTIIGVVKLLESSMVDSFAKNSDYYTIIEPVRQDGNNARYVVKTRPGQQATAMDAARAALFAANPERVIDEDRGIRSFAQIRHEAYRADRGMAILMGVVCLIMLCVTAAGIVGLTSFWVGQRHRQIGVRRALGARKIDILRYFQIENLMIAGGGVAVGVVLAVCLNLWLMTHYEMPRIPLMYVLIGMVALLALGQAAVFVPARRASRVSPIEATRAA
jgi:putative ABC transport system permease protein